MEPSAIASSQNEGAFVDPVTDAILGGSIRKADTVQRVQQLAMERETANNALIQGQTAETNRLVAEQVGVISNLFSQKEIVQRQEVLDRVKADRQVQDIAARTGADLSDPNSVFAAVASEYQQAAQRVAQSSAAVRNASSSSLFNNPFQWLFDQIALPDLQNAAKASSDEAQRLHGILTGMKENISAASDIAEKTKTSLDPAVIDARLKAVTADLQSQKNVATIQAIGYGTTALRNAIAADSQIVEGVHRARSMQLQEEASARQATLQALAVKEAKLKLKEAETKEAARAQTLAAAQIGFTIHNQGKNVPSLEQLAIMRETNPTQFATWAESGFVNMTTTTSPEALDGVRYLGATVGEAVYRTRVAKSGAGQSPLLQYAGQSFQGNFDDYNNKNPSAKEEDAIRAAVDKTNIFMRESVARWSKSAESKDSFYAAPTVGEILKLAPKLGNSDLGKLLSTVKDHQADVATVEAFAKQLIKANPKSANVVAMDVTSIYMLARNYNNTVNNFRGVGLPEQTSYVVNGVDYTDYSKVQYRLAKSLLSDSYQGTFPTPIF